MLLANRFLLLTSVVALSFNAWPAAAKPPKDTVTIDSRIQTAIHGFPGSVSLFAKNLETGKSYELRADAPVPTASTIKLPIMVELFAEAEEGKLDWNQKLELTIRTRCPAAGC
jgi:beta-lactamase class A